MMVDNGLSRLPHPIETATSDMAEFPDATSDWGAVGGKYTDPEGILYGPEDIVGYLLYGHDRTGGGSPGPLVNYTLHRYSKGTYTVDASGTVTQVGYE